MNCRIALFVVCMAFGASVFAQQPQERRLGRDRLGDPVVWMPGAISTDMLTVRIASAAGVPLIVEAAPEVGGSATSQARVTLNGLTVSQALDVYATFDARYQWRETKGVFIVRPTAQVTDPTSLLNRPVADVKWNDVTVTEALGRLGTALAGTSVTPRILAASVDDRTVKVHVNKGTVLDVLVEIAREHGALIWTTPSLTQGVEAGVSLGFQTFDGRGADIKLPISVLAPQ